MKETFFKLLIIGLLLIGIAFFNGEQQKPKTLENLIALKTFLESEKTPDTAYYFLGSSRVQASIDHHRLATHLASSNVYNLGIAGGTFLENCILANYLIEKKGAKHIYIELSPLKYSIQDRFLLISEELDIDPIWSSGNLFNLPVREFLLIKLNVIDRHTFSRFSLENTVKKIFMYKKKAQSIAWFGHAPKTGSELNESPLFFEARDLLNLRNPNRVNLDSYHQVIDFLIQKGQSENAQIIFFLPMTYNRELEKDIVIPLFNSLDSKNKLTFTNHFITEMNDPDLLFDRNHYNQKGSERYTNLFYKEIVRSKKSRYNEDDEFSSTNPEN